MSAFYAHTTSGPPEEWQLLTEHLMKVAERAAKFAAKFNSSAWGEWAGLFHDLGKFSREFQDYLKRSAASGRRRGRVNHSAAGAQEIQRLMAGADPRGAFYAALLAYILAGHHGGLPDGGAASVESGSLKERLVAAIPAYGAWEGKINPPPLPGDFPPPTMNAGDRQATAFAVSFFIRMLFSCLVDADWLDTEGFCAPDKKEKREKFAPAGRAQLQTMLGQLNAELAKLAGEPDKSSANVHKWRQKVLTYCRAAAGGAGQIYSLTVPTGGGKTLAALAFALERAAAKNLDRIIYVAPFISIIDQTAQKFREIFGDEAVLEHHSNYLHPGEKAEEGTDNGTDEAKIQAESQAEAATQARLACQNWQGPLIATTAVQFFESLFASKPSRCRKLHNICRSVIILDEAQNLPLELLAPSVAALKELARSYGATILLCTATQPALDKARRLRSGFEDGQIQEIIPAGELGPLFSDLRRTRFVWLGKKSDRELADMIRERRSALAVTNTKAEAQALFEALGAQDEGHYLLTARLYPAHRRKILEDIKKRLEAGQVCRVISTSLVEAGVDLDFQCVFRALAGLDNIAQAAGRANRHGLSPEPAAVYIYLPEKGLPARAPSFQRRAAAAEYFLEQGLDDLLDPEIQKQFFQRLYEAQDSLDGPDILRRLAKADKSYSNLPFRTVDSRYRFIDDGQENIIVVLEEESKKLVENLRFGRDLGKTLRLLQQYTVSVYPHERAAMEKNGWLELINGQFWATYEAINCYNKQLGLVWNEPGDPGGLIY